MAISSMPTIFEEAELRQHLQETLEELPNNLPHYDEMRLLNDLCFLICSPLFLYAITPRLTTPLAPSTPLPPTPKSMTSDKPTNAFDISLLDIRIKWTDNSWVAQLSCSDNILLEGRQLNVKQEVGFVQSFFWFCEEASFLAYEYKAREGAWTPRKSGEGRSKTHVGRRSLKLKLRLRDNTRGRAGVWRVE